MKSTIRAFSRGLEFAAWENHNCAACANSGQDSYADGGEYHWGTCPMEDALTEACVADCQVDADLAQQYGWDLDQCCSAAPERCAKFRLDDRHGRRP